MSTGMNILSLFAICQIGMACIYNLGVHKKLIFTDRVAPKFIFDMARAMII